MNKNIDRIPEINSQDLSVASIFPEGANFRDNIFEWNTCKKNADGKTIAILCYLCIFILTFLIIIYIFTYIVHQYIVIKH